MKRSALLACVLLFCSLSLAGCGYYFPHVYDAPKQTIYMPDWPNRTSKLGLDNRIYQSLARWFQKSDSIKLTKQRAGASYVLAGEIVAIDLPSVSWDGVTRATGVNVRLNVRYVLKNLESGEIVWEVPGKVYTADYLEYRGSEEAALRKIVDDMAEDIYIGTLRRLRHQVQGKTGQDTAAGASEAKAAEPAGQPAQ